MRPALVFALWSLAACTARGSEPRRTARSSAAPSAAERRPPGGVGRPALTTAVFEDEIELGPRTPRSPSAQSARELAGVSASLAAQLAAREGIQWSATRPLRWTDFRGTPEAEGRTAALSQTGQISGSACTGSRLRYGVLAVFGPRDSWVRPRIAADPDQSARALAHEQTHFNITEVIARELRRTFATIPHPCAMSQAERDSLGAAAFKDERIVQQRYDDQTNHGLDLAAQRWWQAWVLTRLDALGEWAGTAGGRED